MAAPGLVYLLHFDREYKKGQMHYVGFARDHAHLKERIDRHRSGFGGDTTHYAYTGDVPFSLVKVFKAPRGYKDEKKVKNNTYRLCPICNALLATAIDSEIHARDA